MSEREEGESPPAGRRDAPYSPTFENAGAVVGPEVENCPWCGFPLPPGGEACAYCKWTRKGTSIKRQGIIYGLFVLVMIVGFGLAVLYVGRLAP